ncbi:unnamed protein product, partial [Mesorhabditis belari]|uniref:GOLD domain-containing protein n=1 Tax=Mesorhabditis belari TaxID=2138241 RepID=A0AAF3EJ87_9BILA
MLLLPLFFLILSFGSTHATTRFKNGENQVSRYVTFDLDSRMTCFWEPLEKGMNIKLNLRTYRSETYHLQLRFSSPSGELSDWQNGDGLVGAYYNVTETGDHEICIHTRNPCRVNLHLYFYDPEAIEAALAKWLEEHELSKNVQSIVQNLVQNLYKIKYSIKYYNSITQRDEEMQQSNSDNIKNFSVTFISISVIIALLQVYLVRRMFFVDEKRIRI